jgi:hypothetical protein
MFSEHAKKGVSANESATGFDELHGHWLVQ